MDKLSQIFWQFKTTQTALSIKPFGSGHINDTYKVTTEGKAYLLQKINHHIFKKPTIIQQNMTIISEYLESINYPYTILKPIKAGRRNTYKDEEGNYWRVLPFVENSYAIDQVSTPLQALQAATTFGQFAYYLDGFKVEYIKDTIPKFHDAKSRWQTFEKALKNDKAHRKAHHKDLVEDILNLKYIILTIADLQESGQLPIRLAHNDTKINNILFDKNTQEVLAVVDWDTIMQGTILSDFGDMVRSYSNTGAEDEKNLDKVAINIGIFEAIVKGYMTYGRLFLTPIEVENLVKAALWIVYEQTIRFFGDYLNGDTYYKTHYPDHNLVRTKSQLALLKSILSHQDEMEEIVGRWGEGIGTVSEESDT